MGNIVGIPRRVFIIALAVLTAEVVWLLWSVFTRHPLWPSLAVFVATVAPVLVAAILRGGAARVLNALARSALSVAAGYVIGVPVYVVWIKHVRWATAWQDWSPVFIVVLIFGVACLLLGRTVRPGQG